VPTLPPSPEWARPAGGYALRSWHPWVRHRRRRRWDPHHVPPRPGHLGPKRSAGGDAPTAVGGVDGRDGVRTRSGQERGRPQRRGESDGRLPAQHVEEREQEAECRERPGVSTAGRATCRSPGPGRGRPPTRWHTRAPQRGAPAPAARAAAEPPQDDRPRPGEGPDPGRHDDGVVRVEDPLGVREDHEEGAGPRAPQEPAGPPQAGTRLTPRCPEPPTSPTAASGSSHEISPASRLLNIRNQLGSPAKPARSRRPIRSRRSWRTRCSRR